MRMRGDRKRASIITAAGVLLSLCAQGAAAQLYQGNAVTLRPGEIADGMFAASNAFAEGTEITVRNLETGQVVEVEVVARANGGLVLLLLAPAAADALGIGAGEIVPVDAQLISVAVDPGAQGSDPSTSADPDVDPAAGLPASLADYLASLPPVDGADTGSTGDSGVTAAQEGEAEGVATETATTPPIDPDAPPVLTGVPDQPNADAVDATAALANAEAGAEQLLEPTEIAEASPGQPPDTSESDSDAPPPLTLLGVDEAPPLPPSAGPRVAAAGAEPSPPADPSAVDAAVADLAPTTYSTATPATDTLSATAPPSPPAFLPDDELVALLAVPEPTREAVTRAEPTADLPMAVTRVVLVEPTEPRPPVGQADSPPARVTGEALAVVPALPRTPDDSDLAGADGALATATVGQPGIAGAEVTAPPDQVEGTALGVTADVAGVTADLERAPSATGLAVASALGLPPAVDGPVYLLQLGAFSSQSGAQNVAMRVPRSFAPAVVGSEGERPIFKVMIGPLNRDESGTLLYRFRASGFPDAFLIPIPADELAQARVGG